MFWKKYHRDICNWYPGYNYSYSCQVPMLLQFHIYAQRNGMKYCLRPVALRIQGAFVYCVPVYIFVIAFPCKNAISIVTT